VHKAISDFDFRAA